MLYKLQKCLLFKDIDVSNLAFEYDLMEFDQGQIIENKILSERYLGILLEGEITVNNSFTDGNQVIITTLLPFDLYGISNLFLDEDMPSTLISKTHTKVICIRRNEVLNLFKTNDLFVKNYLCLCNEKILFLNKKIQFYNINSSQKKLAYYILCNSKNNRLKNYLNKTQLAEFLGISRSSLYRDINSLKDSKCIEFNNNTFTILDNKKLNSIIFE